MEAKKLAKLELTYKVSGLLLSLTMLLTRMDCSPKVMIQPVPSESIEQTAYIMSTRFVKLLTKEGSFLSSSSGQELVEDLGDSSYIIIGYYFIEHSSGYNESAIFNAVVRYKGGDPNESLNWMAEKMNMNGVEIEDSLVQKIVINNDQ